MSTIATADIEADLAEQVTAVSAAGGALEIVGNGSKRFYGEAVEGLELEVAGHSGIIDYDPAELVITLRAGCPLAEVEALLAAERQMFGFEPPHFGPGATIGGTIACGLAGPRRAFSGSVRDFVLGARILDGRGQAMRFGGRVIKNVAGFDLSRLLVGSLGTLGVILEASIRVMPQPERELTLAFEHERADDHIRWVNELGSQPFPVSASSWHEGRSYLRLSGSEQGIAQAVTDLGGETVDYDWRALGELEVPLLATGEPLTRLALPPACPDVMPGQAQLIEWGGARRWMIGDVNVTRLREEAAKRGGSACAFRGHAGDVPVFHPPSASMLKLQRGIKSSLDPARIFNAGRIFAEL